MVLSLSTMSLLVSHCLWVHPKYAWSRHDVGSPKSTSLLSAFHIGWLHCLFPSNFYVLAELCGCAMDEWGHACILLCGLKSWATSVWLLSGSTRLKTTVAGTVRGDIWSVHVDTSPLSWTKLLAQLTRPITDQKTNSSSHRLHVVPKRIVCTIRNETSTTTRHRNANIPAARWSRRVSAICWRKARGHNNCSGSDGVSRQRDRGEHRGKFINWSRGHARLECRLCTRSGPVTFSLPTTVTGTSHDDFPCNINGNGLPVCSVSREAALSLLPEFSERSSNKHFFGAKPKWP